MVNNKGVRMITENVMRPQLRKIDKYVFLELGKHSSISFYYIKIESWTVFKQNEGSIKYKPSVII